MTATRTVWSRTGVACQLWLSAWALRQGRAEPQGSETAARRWGHRRRHVRLPWRTAAATAAALS